MINKDDFELKIISFVDNINLLYLDYMEKRFPKNNKELVKIYSIGPKYIKLVQGHFVFAFIDRATGDIFKAASWESPAKHVRGNLFSLQGGMESISTDNNTIHPHIRYLK